MDRNLSNLYSQYGKFLMKLSPKIPKIIIILVLSISKFLKKVTMSIMTGSLL